MIRLLRVRPADLLPGDWVRDERLKRDHFGFATSNTLLSMHCVGEVLRSGPRGAEVTTVPSSDRSISGVKAGVSMEAANRAFRQYIGAEQ